MQALVTAETKAKQTPHQNHIRTENHKTKQRNQNIHGMQPNQTEKQPQFQ